MGQPAYSAISSYSRVQILHQLQERPARTVQDLTEATGLHANTVREHLQRLIEAGYVVVETEHRTTRGRPRVLYSAATGTDAASSPVAQRKARDAARRGDLMRRVLPWTDTPDPAGAPLPAEVLHQLDALVDDLEGAGFDPIVDEAALTVDLTPCAHAQTHATHRDVLCAVHLGLMQSVLTEARGPLAVDGMNPSCDPAECVVQLSRA
ncbi:MAG: ArsR family transcriptional regulator [Microbacterium sp.]|uniref:ArsR family transcriptional regulator n=1 Tax=Microbacterium sp. TaxID=51671 RepID=UPI001AC6E60A|nr:ArsR family transcriptional regulator [Microbacterium sp.]MBN9153414.1 ArsR family transcriptional regulator [Microbacterium sp.]MBN9174944.1 ArsR family transcriptional regulator [Microbacterium sp.]